MSERSPVQLPLVSSTFSSPVRCCCWLAACALAALPCAASTPCCLQPTLTTVPTTGARRPADGIGAVVLSRVLAKRSGKTRVRDKLANCKSMNHESARIKLHVPLVLLGVK